MINKDRHMFQYNDGDLVYIISPLTSQLQTSSRKVAIKYIGPSVLYKNIDPHSYLLVTLAHKILYGLFGTKDQSQQLSEQVNAMFLNSNLTHIKEVKNEGIRVST